MASTSTSRLGLFKPVPGSGEPFRTSDLNANSDKIDAEAVAVDARFDLVEADVAAVEADVTSIEGQLAGMAAAWVTYTPTLGGGLASGFTVSNAFYGRAGKTVFVRGVLSCGGASGSGLTLSLPVEAKAPVVLFDGVAVKSTGNFPLFVSVATSGGVSTASFNVLSTGSTYGSRVALATNVPASWTSDDSIQFAFVYEGV